MPIIKAHIISHRLIEVNWFLFLNKSLINLSNTCEKFVILHNFSFPYLIFHYECKETPQYQILNKSFKYNFSQMAV